MPGVASKFCWAGTCSDFWSSRGTVHDPPPKLWSAMTDTHKNVTRRGFLQLSAVASLPTIAIASPP